MKKILIAFFLFIVISVMFFLLNHKSKKFLPLIYLKNPCEITIYNKLDAKLVYITLEFKNAGVLQNSEDTHGISALISKLLFRKIKKLEASKTEEKLQQLGVTNLLMNGLSDDFVISFSIVENQFKPAIEFLISGLGEKFSENDLSYAKEFFPTQINPENSQPNEILLDKLYQNLYPNHIYGKNKTGSSDSLTKITLEDINKFIENNFTLDNLKIYYAGNYSIEKLRTLVDNLSKFLSKKSNQNKNSDFKNVKVNTKEEKISNNNIRDVCGIATGIRLDNLSQLEKASLYIVADTLFNEVNGEFLKTNIPMNHSYSINDRRLSTVLILTTFIQKKDLDQYLRMQNDFFSNLNISQLQNSELARNNFIENQKLFSLRSLRNSLVFLGLPFENCNDETYKKILQKIQQPNVRSSVIILSE